MHGSLPAAAKGALLPDSAPSFASQIAARITELRQQIEARLAPTRGGGELVLIVPGLPGSELGKGGHKLWLDFAAVRGGRLLELAYDPGAPPLEVMGVFDLIYLQIQLRLRLRGYDVAVHPFDWRRPLPELGAELAVRLAAAGRQVHVVAHSMGGLVTRAATILGAPNLGKVILLGTPNHGSFTVVQGIRGRHWLLHLLSAVDAVHSADDLATGAFATWPSVYAQLPAGGDLDLLDPRSWPSLGPRPQLDLLQGAPGVQEWLAGSRGQFHVIAGHGRATVDGVRRGDGGFVYLQSDGGDGWVPTRLARLDDCPCYFAASGHILMPNDEAVIVAVEDLLARGESDLPQAPPPPRALAPTSDRTPPPSPFGGRVGHDITEADVVDALTNLVEPALI